MIGDRLNTDIEFGKNGGLSTLLVLTGEECPVFVLVLSSSSHVFAGITKESEITGPNASPTVPDYVTKSLGDFCVLI